VVVFGVPGDDDGMDRQTGAIIIAFGLGAVVLGLLVWSGALSWFGRLPGDIRVERDSARVYIPITSMLLVSAALSLVAYLIRRFFGS
jgi:hypothetical protein